jgi:hypothetical protein
MQLTESPEEIHRTPVELKDVSEKEAQNPLHVHIRFEECTGLLHEREVLSNPLVCIEQTIESLCVRTSRLTVVGANERNN